MKDSIPYSQFLRVRHNCTLWSDYLKQAIRLYLYFQQRSYPSELLKSAISKVGIANQVDLIQQKKENNPVDRCFYYIMDYNPMNPNIQSIIDDAMRYCERSSSTRTLLQTNVIYEHRKPKNISDFVVRTNLPTDNKRRSFPPKCNRFFKCKHCPNIQNSKANKTVPLQVANIKSQGKYPIQAGI